jgi:4-hydroxy-L-threonine phosphate dehydrogenase PdxA
MGDPAGTGPELLVKALTENETRDYARPIVVGSASVMRAAVSLVGVDAKINAMKGEAHAVVTSAINKKTLNEAGYHFDGHTKILAHLTNASQFEGSNEARSDNGFESIRAVAVGDFGKLLIVK